MALGYDEIRFTVRFVTPAFLGNARQESQWRVPPFRGLFRAMYRIYVAGQCSYNHAVVREKEGDTWGRAGHSSSDSVRSSIEICIDGWRHGKNRRKQLPWGKDAQIYHPEVGRNVGDLLYLGYGPISYEKGTGYVTPKTPTIDSGEHATIHLRFRSLHISKKEVQDLLQLSRLLGTIGGRSRNGWGSFDIQGDAIESLDPIGEEAYRFLEQFSVDWRGAVRSRNWPSGIGRDEKGLLRWRTDPCRSWKEAMKKLAEVRIAIRTHFMFPQNCPKKTHDHQQPEDRHVLAYPVTHHRVKSQRRGRVPPGAENWGPKGRFANSLRFKVFRLEKECYVGVIIHIPTKVPLPGVDPAMECQVWKNVHRFLDAARTGSLTNNQGVRCPKLIRC